MCEARFASLVLSFLIPGMLIHSLHFCPSAGPEIGGFVDFDIIHTFKYAKNIFKS